MKLSGLLGLEINCDRDLGLDRLAVKHRRLVPPLENGVFCRPNQVRVPTQRVDLGDRALLIYRGLQSHCAGYVLFFGKGGKDRGGRADSPYFLRLATYPCGLLRHDAHHGRSRDFRSGRGCARGNSLDERLNAGREADAPTGGNDARRSRDQRGWGSSSRVRCAGRRRNKGAAEGGRVRRLGRGKGV
jgi:hypothetical protein